MLIFHFKKRKCCVYCCFEYVVGVDRASANGGTVLSASDCFKMEYSTLSLKQQKKFFFLNNLCSVFLHIILKIDILIDFINDSNSEFQDCFLNAEEGI